jgi:anti-sigma factor ChrR (cupin superfamily)
VYLHWQITDLFATDTDDVEISWLRRRMAPPALIDQQRPTAPGVHLAQVRQMSRMPKRAAPRVLQNATTAAHLLDSEQGQGLFVMAWLGPMTKTTPTTARRMTDNRITSRVAARITCGIPHITHQAEVTGIRASEENGYTMFK